MAFHHWSDCPPEVKRQIDHLILAFKEHLPGLKGIYLHGSLAMGCFNPAASDLDLLVVSSTKIPSSAVPSILYALLEISRKPIPIEVSILNQQDLKPWQHPALYDLHYSEHWREDVSRLLEDGSWKENYSQVKKDEDLAAHITITHQFGICLWGEPIETVFPFVPADDFTDAILFDMEWIGERVMSDPIYTVLNLCRVDAFIQSGLICSKAGAAYWALENLDKKWFNTVQKAFDCYQGENKPSFFTEDEIRSFYNEMAERVLRIKTTSRKLATNHE